MNGKILYRGQIYDADLFDGISPYTIIPPDYFLGNLGKNIFKKIQKRVVKKTLKNAPKEQQDAVIKKMDEASKQIGAYSSLKTWGDLVGVGLAAGGAVAAAPLVTGGAKLTGGALLSGAKKLGNSTLFKKGASELATKVLNKGSIPSNDMAQLQTQYQNEVVNKQPYENSVFRDLSAEPFYADEPWLGGEQKEANAPPVQFDSKMLLIGGGLLLGAFLLFNN